jgi:hypothetical protein
MYLKRLPFHLLYSISLFSLLVFLLCTHKKKKKNQQLNILIGGGSFPFTIVIELGRAVGMRLENDLVTAQCVTEWTQKFALFFDFFNAPGVGDWKRVNDV